MVNVFQKLCIETVEDAALSQTMPLHAIDNVDHAFIAKDGAALARIVLLFQSELQVGIALEFIQKFVQGGNSRRAALFCSSVAATNLR